MLKKFRVHERGPRLQTRDALITTGMRINAEPAPPGPDLGTLHVGNPRFGIMATQDDISEIQNSLAENGLISKEDASAIQAIPSEVFGSGRWEHNPGGHIDG